MPDDLSKDPRVYFAAERTFLAWIRTGVAMMGFGFVVARFGLFLRELQVSQSHTEQQSPRLSLWIGIALVVIGVAVNISAAVRQSRLIERLKRGEWEIGGQSRMGIAIVVTLTGVGLVMAAYLIFMR
ncbi:MAG: DUF202 domain-containing protein [Acidobacteriaceae bacterium]|nr:DUF202 domain-containing protein [Acidobacteriaceae bacterium]